MKIKLDSENRVVLKDGLPVYTYPDGSEAPFDAQATLENLNKKVTNLTEEKDRFYKKAQDFETKFKTFEGIDVEKYKEYEKIVKNLNDQQILDQKGVEALKKTMLDTFAEEKANEAKKYQRQIEEAMTKAEKMEQLVARQTVRNKFTGATEWFGTPQSKTIYPAEDAYMIFGQHFKAEIKGDDIVLYAVDAAGNKIMSKKNHGELADFDEAISQLVDTRAKKYAILRSSGPGGPQIYSNLDMPPGKTNDNLTPRERIQAGLKQRFQNQFPVNK